MTKAKTRLTLTFGVPKDNFRDSDLRSYREVRFASKFECGPHLLLEEKQDTEFGKFRV